MPKPKDEEAALQVFVRVRPPIAKEISLENAVSASGNIIRVCGQKHDVSCAYDHVFNELTDQGSVFTHIKPVLDGILSGINGCVFAYGQTSAGKSYTMLGPNGGQDLSRTSESNRGILPRAAEYLLGTLADMAEDGHLTSYTVKCSFLQIYNESLIDLLRSSTLSAAEGEFGAESSSLKIREVPTEISVQNSSMGGSHAQEVYVAGLSEYRVHTAQDVLQLLQRGTQSRVTSSTDYNATSSRSHAIMQLSFELVSSATAGPSAGSGKELMRAKLSLVDLAGSEKMSVTTSGLPTLQGDLIEICTQINEAKHVRELTSINKSLSALGNVIHALAQGPSSRPHVPYRDSKLTRLLQDSLGGNTRTVLIACVASSAMHAAETVSTLQFADRARCVMSRVRANVISTGSAEGLRVALERAQAEIERLKGLLTMAYAGRGDGAEWEQDDQAVQRDDHTAAESQSELQRLKRENRQLRKENEHLRSNWVGATARSGNVSGVAGSGFGSGSGGMGVTTLDPLLPSTAFALDQQRPAKGGRRAKKLRAIEAVYRGSASANANAAGTGPVSMAGAGRVYGSSSTAQLAQLHAQAHTQTQAQTQTQTQTQTHGKSLSSVLALDRRLGREAEAVSRELDTEAARLRRMTEERLALQRLLQQESLQLQQESVESDDQYEETEENEDYWRAGPPSLSSEEPKRRFSHNNPAKAKLPLVRAVSPIDTNSNHAAGAGAGPLGVGSGNGSGRPTVAEWRRSIQAASTSMNAPSPSSRTGPGPRFFESTAQSPTTAPPPAAAAVAGGAGGSNGSNSAVAHIANSIARLKAQAEREKERRRVLREEEEAMARTAAQRPRNNSHLSPAHNREAQEHGQVQTQGRELKHGQDQSGPLCFGPADIGSHFQLFSFRHNQWGRATVLEVRVDPSGAVMHLVKSGAELPVWLDLRRKPVREDTEGDGDGDGEENGWS